MTREETKEAIKVMQAFADGKKILYYDGNIDKWIICVFPIWDWHHIDYRIASNQEEPKEKHYRPYTMEEFVEEMHKHDGFVRHINTKNYGGLVTLIAEDCVNVGGYWFYYDQLLDRVWSDNGQPCGKEVAE